MSLVNHIKLVQHLPAGSTDGIGQTYKFPFIADMHT